MPRLCLWDAPLGCQHGGYRTDAEGSRAPSRAGAQAFAYWGVDFVKIDECGGLPSGTTLSSLTTAFEQYGADLRAGNPSVVYSEELLIYALGQSDLPQAVQSSSTFAKHVAGG
jgi:hypothetical protein